MSGDYVSKATAINKIMENIVHQDSHDVNLHNIGLRKAMSAIDSLPTADVVKVRRGRWSLVEARRKESVYRCSECGNFFTIRADTLNGGRGDMRYCPNCGVKNDGGNDDD